MTDKIKRAILWIRKSLEITERTDVPGSIDERIRPIIDVLGWDRYTELQQVDAGQANANLSALPVVPEGTMRLYVALSGETNDTTNSFTHWMEVGAVAVTAPVVLPARTIIVKAGHLANPILVRPGLNVVARCSPATAGGFVLRARGLFVDLPVGEYMPSL